MQFTKNTKGFTLIELLVVITIIGILAVGGTTVYTSQIQKARDTTRMNDVSALKSGVEQFYQDGSVYPDTTSFSGVQTYVPKLPKDPKAGQTCNKGNLTSGFSSCNYVYGVGTDANGIDRGAYELSTAFENSGNMTAKALNTVDGGNDDIRWEIGLRLDVLSTAFTGASATSLSGATCSTVPGGSSTGIIIAGNCN